jgi:Zn-dependent membrane protease YugP
LDLKGHVVAVLLITVVVVVVLLRTGLHRAPMLTLLCIGLFGLAVHTGILTLPAAITTPVHHISSSVRSWQQSESDALVCEAAQASALRAMDNASLERAQNACTTTGP